MDLAPTIPSSLRTPAGIWSFAWAWLLGFGLIAYLGLNGGGFDPLVSSQAGILIWWVVLLGTAVGAMPRRRFRPIVLVALGLFAGLALWTGLSLTWTESTEKTAADLSLLATFLGSFALALLTRGRESAREVAAAMASAIAVIAIVGMLSRLHPDWFPAAAETGRFLDTGRERLSYPLDYWNSLAALIGVGLPLMIQLAASARAVAIRGLAAAAVPAMSLALLFTLSRAGIACSLLAVALFVLLTRDRIAQGLTVLVTGAGAALLAAMALQRSELAHGMTEATGRAQGREMFWVTLVVCLLVGLAQVGIALAGRRRERPGWSRVSKRDSLIACGVAVGLALIVALAISAPGRIADGWDEFREPSGQSVEGTSRLTSVGGENRYQLWSAAVREFEDDPLKGTGSNTFQLWWTRDGDVGEPIVDTHNLYLQILGELGLIGLGLLLAFLAVAYWGVVGKVLRAPPVSRPALAAAVAGSTVLWTTSLVDWGWKIPVLPIATLILLATVLAAGEQEPEGGATLKPPLRIGAVLVAVAALVAITIPFASTSLVRQSQADARRGDTEVALADARSAQNVEPGAASPRLQQALLLESLGDFDAAAAAAAGAAEREPTNWRIWLVRSRIAAERGEPGQSLRFYREAKSLNPLSPVFTDAP